MPLGSPRPNAGRPTNAAIREKKAAAAKDTATFTRNAVAALGHNFEKLQELANGVWYEQTTPDGARRVYKKLPDRQAAMFLVEAARGKAAQASAVQQETAISISFACKKCGTSTFPRPVARVPLPELEEETSDGAV